MAGLPDLEAALAALTIRVTTLETNNPVVLPNVVELESDLSRVKARLAEAAQSPKDT